MRKSMVLLGVAALLLSACGGDEEKSTDTTAAEDATAGTDDEMSTDTTEAGGGADTTVAGEPAEAGGLVGIAMPTRSSSRWIADGDAMVGEFEKLGYETDLQYAEDDIPTQVSQIENMITKGANVLVIAAIDGVALTDVLAKAKAGGVAVFAYDRLIRESDAVSFYATFDNFQVGVLQAQSLVDGLEADTAAGPFNIELFAGSPDDNNAKFFFDGAMSVLQPLIDKGTLVVGSGQTDFEKVAILRWDPATAQSRMDNLLSSTYTDKDVQAVLSPYDGLSRGIIASLKGVGYFDSKTGPLVSGQDAELESVKSMVADEQFSTVFKDTRVLAAQTAKMVDQLLAGEEVEVNDTETYDNGVLVVPSYLLEPVSVLKADIESVLVGSGYWTDADING